MPTAVEMPEALVGKPLATISLPGTVAADGGLGASVSASQGLRFHFEDRPRFVLSPRPVPDDFGGEARCDFRPLPRQEGECAVLGLRRLLGLSLQPTEPAEATRFLCTLILWAQEMAYEFDLRGGVVLWLEVSCAPLLEDAYCRWVTQLFAHALPERVSVELRAGARSAEV